MRMQPLRNEAIDSIVYKTQVCTCTIPCKGQDDTASGGLLTCPDALALLEGVLLRRAFLVLRSAELL